MYEHQLVSGTQTCPFVLKDETGSIPITLQGGQVISYPHKRILKSESGQRTGIGDRMKKMKEMDRQQHPKGEKKPLNSPLVQKRRGQLTGNILSFGFSLGTASPFWGRRQWIAADQI